MVEVNIRTHVTDRETDQYVNWDEPRVCQDTSETVQNGMAERLAVRWYVMRAYKSEFRTGEQLESVGIEHFIPKRYAVRSYHGRKTRRFVPVIPSMVFVRSSRVRIREFKQNCPRLQFVMRREGDSDGFTIVPDSQMENFIRVSSRTERDLVYFRPDELPRLKGTRVRIHGGDFDGVEGMLMRVEGKRNRRVVVMLDGILAVAAEVHPDLVEIIGGNFDDKAKAKKK